MKNSKSDLSGSATADDVRDAVTELFANFSDAAAILPAAWLADAIADVVAATAHTDSGRRGDCMRTFLRDLHRELADAHQRLQSARAAGYKPPTARRVALVG